MLENVDGITLEELDGITLAELDGVALGELDASGVKQEDLFPKNFVERVEPKALRRPY